MKRKGRLIFLIAASLVGLSLLSPYLAALALERLLVAQGFGHATVERVGLKPIDGSLELRGLSAGQAGAEQLRLRRLYLKLNSGALFDRRLIIEKLEVDGLHLDVQQDPQGAVRIAGLTLPQADAALNKGDEDSRPWQLELHSLVLRQDSVDIIGPELRAQLHIDSGSLSDLNYPSSEGSSTLALSGTINGSPLTIESTLSPFAKQPAAELQLTLKQLAPMALLPRLQQQLYGLELNTEQLELEGRLRLIDGSPLIHASLRSQGMALSEYNAPLLSIGTLSISDIEFAAPQRLTVNAIDIQALKLSVDLDEQGALRRPSLLRQTAQKSEDKDKGSPLQLRLGGLNLKQAEIDFSDAGVTPHFKERLSIDSLTLSSIDSTQATLQSELALKAKIGDFAELSLKGSAQAFAAKLNVDGELVLKQLELPPLSPYLARLLGYQFESGQLGQELTLNIKDNQLEGEARIRLTNLEVEEAVQVSENSLKAKLDLPLTTALALLRDNDNNIELDIPFSGDVASPAFDPGDVITTALAKGLKVAGVGYLKLALQPYGAALSLLQMAGKALKYIPLDPVNYAAANSDAQSAEHDYLQKLAQLMEDRSGLRLRLCGFATPTDREGMSKTKDGKKVEVSNEQLRALAAERSRALKKRLVDDYGIDAGRLFLCHPAIDEDIEASGRVEIGI